MWTKRSLPASSCPARRPTPWWNPDRWRPARCPRWSRCGWARLTSGVEGRQISWCQCGCLYRGSGLTWQILLSSLASSMMNNWLSTSGSFFSSFTRLRDSWGKNTEVKLFQRSVSEQEYVVLSWLYRPSAWFWASWQARWGTAGTPSSCLRPGSGARCPVVEITKSLSVLAGTRSVRCRAFKSAKSSWLGACWPHESMREQKSVIYGLERKNKVAIKCRERERGREMTAELWFHLCGSPLGAPPRPQWWRGGSEGGPTHREVQNKRQNSDKRLPTYSAHRRRAAEWSRKPGGSAKYIYM